jgi:hypothetical protein
MQGQCIHAKSRRDLLNPADDQPQQVRWVAARPGEADPQPLRHPVDPVGDQLDDPRAQPGFGERCDEARHEISEPMLDCLGGCDWFGKALDDGDRLGWHDGIERLADPSSRLIEPGNQSRTEAPGKWRPRHCEELADAVDTQALEELDRGDITAERGDRQRGQGIDMSYRGADRYAIPREAIPGEAGITRECPGCTRCISHRDPSGHAQPGQ